MGSCPSATAANPLEMALGMELQATNVGFRDPLGRVFIVDRRIFRNLTKPGFEGLQEFLASDIAERWIDQGKLVESVVCAQVPSGLGLPKPESAEAIGDFWIEHSAVFPSYPFEWPPEMLHAAAVLTLDFAKELLPYGMGLKDATPYNVLFRHGKPIFVDVLSVEKRNPRDPIWLPYAQFVRTFLLPLLVNQQFGLPVRDSMLSRRDGLEPTDVYPLCGPFQHLRPLFLSLVSLPTWLSKKLRPSPLPEAAYTEPEKALFVLKRLLAGLRRKLNKMLPSSASSKWSGYMTDHDHYAGDGFERKQQILKDVMAEFSPRTVLDIGCNTGHFSSICARAGADVVAIDNDSAVIGRLWSEARQRHLSILPLVIDISRPSPAVGWMNQECSSFLERASGEFDLVVMLALVHHLLVSEGIPLNQILDLAYLLSRDLVLIEFVPPDDVKFRQLARGRDYLHKYLTISHFEAACRKNFEIIRSEKLAGSSRHIFLLRKR